MTLNAQNLSGPDLEHAQADDWDSVAQIARKLHVDRNYLMKLVKAGKCGPVMGEGQKRIRLSLARNAIFIDRSRRNQKAAKQRQAQKLARAPRSTLHPAARNERRSRSAAPAHPGG